MSWQDVYGHHGQKQFFAKVLASRKIAHAYLFFGPVASGKKFFALELARTLLCLAPQENNSCGTCESCRLFSSGTHPDFIALSPEENSIKIERVREFIKNMYLQRVMSPYKVGLVFEVEKLTEEASNCLLKTVEEPPHESVIILTTSQLHSLLPTIVSRCQLVKFSSRSFEEVRQYLVEKVGVEETRAIRAASLAMGSIDEALQILAGKQGKYEQFFRFWEDFKRGGKVTPAFREFSALSPQELVSALVFFEGYLREVFWYRIMSEGTSHFLLPREWEGIVKEDSERFSFFTLIRMIELLEEAIEDLTWHVQQDIVVTCFLLALRGEIGHELCSGY